LRQPRIVKKHGEILQEFREKLSAIPDKKKRVEETIYLITIYGDSYADRMIPLLEEVRQTTKDCNFEVGEIICLLNLKFFEGVTQGASSSNLFDSPDFPPMLEKIKGDEKWYPFGLHTIAFIHWFNGDYEKAFSVIFEAIRSAENRKYPYDGWLYFALGVFYFDTKDLENSRISYQKALDKFSVSNDLHAEYGMARASNGLGTVAVWQNRLEEARPLLEYSTEVYKKLSHYAGLSRALNDMALLQKKEKNYDKAITLLTESIVLRREIDHVQGLITSHTELGEIYLTQKQYEPALEHFNIGLGLAKKANTRQKQVRLYKLLYDTYKQLSNTERALENFEHFFEIKTQLLSDEAANNLKKIQNKYEKENAERETELEKLKNAELEGAYTIIKQKNSEIEEQRRDIISSINYASRIQFSILPNTEVISTAIPESFIIYKPKDIVSGDFYWFHELDPDNYILVCADCTGHGVPGALMTVIGSNLLNQIITGHKILKPSEILLVLDNFINLTLKQQTTHEHFVQDGMDLTLLKVDRSKKEFVFCSAKRPALFFRNNELHEFKGNKHSLGGMITGCKVFSETTMQYKVNDVIYLFTDGCTDQFGGEHNKKFSTRQLKELLTNVHSFEISEQKAMLEKVIDDWKGRSEQTDDMLLMGIRF
jgi:serine phosphatase RsbU (regulator of sigma subunit)